ncbi:MAG: aminopeptidase P family protein [Hyphomicrobiaceae bacterium]
MFQDFSSPVDASATTDRVAAVRALMTKAGLDALLVPRADCHQGEYVPRAAERLAWLTGFTGSAGMAAVGRKRAALFIDGRYTLQVRQQADRKTFEFLQVPDQKVSDWLKHNLASGAVVGFDPWLHTVAEVERMTTSLKDAGIQLKPTRSNLVDRAWGDERPSEPAGPVSVHPLKYAGTPSAEKIARVQETLKADGQDAVVLTLPDSVSWLLNIRGADVAHNPVVLAFAIVPVRGRVELFLDPKRADPELRAHLSGIAKVTAPRELTRRLSELKAQGKRVRLDADSAAYAIARALGRSNVVRGRDPCVAPKAVKVGAEIKGARAAHQRDGIAMARFLAWVDANAGTGDVDEIAAVRKLEEMRRRSNMLREISFDTISGSGPNGAIVHYRVTEATNRLLKPGELFLIDSGAQYPDGTTDITRTVAVGEPTRDMRERYTAVLKGHIAISMALFPKGTRGVDLDPLARRPLWALGLDYDHGTGHGVGSYLSVHEGPASISRRGMVELQPGMILSNEPGFYRQGAYGIRIENLVLVSEPKIPAGGERAMMSFETLTLAPYDRRLIEVSDLAPDECNWINAYHARVSEEIAPHLDGEDRSWLLAATQPL